MNPHSEDLYPSRYGGQTQILERRDPVVHGDPRKGPLSTAEIDAFERDGYLFFDHFFEESELVEYQEELDRLFEASRDNLTDEVIREPESDVIRSIFRVHATNALFSRLSRDGRILERVMQLVGSEAYVHHSRINYKPGFDGKEFYWHSDFETWHVEDGMPRMRAVSCSIALTENNDFNGPLMVIPGSHKHYVSCPGETPEDHFQNSLRKQEVGVPDHEALTELVRRGGGIHQAKGPPGSLLMFECNIMHGSNSNISPFPRSNFFVVYNSVENGLVEPFGGRKPRPEFIRATDFTPLRPA